MNRDIALTIIRTALREDAAHRDITSRAVLPTNLRIRARIIAKAPGVLAGVKLAALVFTTFDRSLRCRLHRHSGATLSRGSAILTVEGRARSIFAAERTALNFLGHLSGIATLTRRYVDRVRGTRAVILDTRKTIPSLRALEKYAVRAGGGRSHRGDLAEAVLIKTNHLRAISYQLSAISQNAIQEAVKRARRARPRRFVEIEVANLREFRAALEAKPDAVLLDNWPLKNIRRAVVFRNSALPRPDPACRGGRTPHSALPLLEVSGGVTLKNVRAIAKTGVNRISVGRLTHSAPALNVSLKVL